MKFPRTVLFLLSLTISVTLPARTQNLFTGELTVAVTDRSGAAITKASAALTSQAIGQQISIPSSDTGEFRFPLLPPGVYTLSVTAEGFETWSQQTTVELGQSSNLKIQLGIETRKEEVQVSALSTMLQTNNANVATTFDQRQIQNLPNPGNDLTVFAFTAPGVTMSTGQGNGNFSVFGLPSISNLFTINGADVTDLYENINPSGASNLMLGTNEILPSCDNGWTASPTSACTGPRGNRSWRVGTWTSSACSCRTVGCPIPTATMNCARWRGMPT